jgi:hypothetical protein
MRLGAAMLTFDEDDYIDPQFEHTIDEAQEKDAIRRVQEVIRNAVADTAKLRRQWREEYADLTHRSASLTWRERLRLKRLGRIFADLPSRPGLATRDVHRKTHGCLAGELQIVPNLPADLAIGVFQPGQKYDAVIRFSNGDPEAQDDAMPDARGMAVKLLEDGTLPRGDDPGVKQLIDQKSGKPIDPDQINRNGILDIVTINYPVFFTINPDAYARVNRAFFGGVRHEDSVLRSFLAFLWTGIVLVPILGLRDAGAALRVNGAVIHNPLFQSYWSMAPSRLGSRAANHVSAVKYKWEPFYSDQRGKQLLAENNPAWADRRDFGFPLVGWIRQLRAIPGSIRSDPDHLRAMIAQTLDPKNYGPGQSPVPIRFALRVQKFIDHENTPIENSSAIWLEHEDQRQLFGQQIPRAEPSSIWKREIAPLHTIAILTIFPVPSALIAGGHTHNDTFIEDLSFNPWNNVPDQHRPLGIVQRMKRRVYAGSRRARFAANAIANPFDTAPSPSAGPDRQTIRV